MTIQLYGCLGTRSDRALWVLEEAGCDYEYRLVDVRKGEGVRSPLIDLNPGGKIPVLVDDDLVLSESAAICMHIADRNPAGRLLPPPATVERALCNQWCCFAISELEQPLWTIAKHSFALPEERRVPAIMETALWEFSVAVEVLAKGLGECEYLVGEQFTIADIMIGYTLGRARLREIPLGYVALERYADRLLARPAYGRVRERESDKAI